MCRIAVVTSYFPTREQPYRGHSAYQTLRKLQQWAEIEVFVPFSVYPRWLTPRTFPYFRPDVTYCPPDIRTHYLEYPALPKVSRFINGYTCSRYVLPSLKTFAPDLVLNYYLYPEGYAAVSAGKVLKVPVILGAIGSDLCRIPDSVTLRLTKRALSDASSVIAVSEDLRQRAIRLGAPAERAMTVPNGCDSSIFRLGDRVSTRRELGLDPHGEAVLYAGRLDAAKGLLELLAAFARIAPERPNLELVLLGEGLLRDELVSRARAEGLANRVRLPGACSSPGVARWMTASRIFCLPSYAEGCPNVIVEALACGRPVVATAVGGIPDLVGANCGVLIPPRDISALSAALAGSLSESWDEAAIARQHRRSWDNVAMQTFDICRSMLRSGAGREPVLRAPQTV